MTRLVSNWERSGITFDISIPFSFSLHVKSGPAGPTEGLFIVIIVLCSMVGSHLRGNTTETLQDAMWAQPKPSLKQN